MNEVFLEPNLKLYRKMPTTPR